MTIAPIFHPTPLPENFPGRPLIINGLSGLFLTLLVIRSRRLVADEEVGSRRIEIEAWWTSATKEVSRQPLLSCAQTEQLRKPSQTSEDTLNV